tara:strand:- start:47 stop:583 length:537 start_codon:yes stop_codon:yes gene_type:complete
MQSFANAACKDLGRSFVSNVVNEIDFSQPIVRKKIITASNDGSMASKINFGDFPDFIFDEPSAHGGSDLGPTPLTGVLASLCACEAVTFNRTAKELDFRYKGIEFSAAFTIDIRGRSGLRGVVPHFQTVKVEAEITTEEEISFLEKVVHETEARCPVYNLIKDAGVKIETVWVRRSQN